MDDPLARNRRRFFAALGLFFVWVATLGTMAALSGYRPTTRAVAPTGP